MQNKTRTQEISALGHLVIQNSSGPVNDKSFYTVITDRTKFIMTYLVCYYMLCTFPQCIIVDVRCHYVCIGSLLALVRAEISPSRFMSLIRGFTCP